MLAGRRELDLQKAQHQLQQIRSLVIAYKKAGHDSPEAKQKRVRAEAQVALALLWFGLAQ